MSRLQDLHPDQQAVLQLVLRRGMPYADLGGILGLAPEGVRERALDAIDGLAPEDVEGLAMEDRDRIADHLLGQDAGPGREATSALLREHAPARAWATTVAGELAPLGGPAAPVPGAPGGPTAGGTPLPPALAGATSGASPAAQAPAAPPAAHVEPTPVAPGPEGSADVAPDAPVGPGHDGRQDDVGAAFDALPAGPRRRSPNPFAGRSPRVLGGAAAAALVVVLLALWIGGVFSGDDEPASASTPPAGTSTAAAASTEADKAAAAQFVAALPQTIRFRPPSSATGAFARVTGTARPTVSAQDAAIPVLALTIRGLPALSNTRRYFAWADKDGAEPVFLGQLEETSGAELPFQGLDLKTRQPTVIDPTVYSRVRITREGTAAPTKPGPTVIVGTITPRS